MSQRPDPFGILSVYEGVQYFELSKLPGIGRIPYSIRVLLEAVVSRLGKDPYSEEQVRALLNWQPTGERSEIPFLPRRVVMQDLTGVPAVADLAAMRDCVKKLGGDPSVINPVLRTDLVIDHSVQVDKWANVKALALNEEIEFQRNKERYLLLKWAQKNLRGFRVVPPARGIVHQVNLEFLSDVVGLDTAENLYYPDSCVGTDSHTPMVNGVGVIAWGVGGIEAEAAMLGQPTPMLIPDVVGLKFTGKLPEGATATDLVLRVTELCRKHGVVEKFVEAFGPGIDSLAVETRATLANMSPEHGCTVTFFPVDAQAVDYLRRTGRPKELTKRVEEVSKRMGLFQQQELKDEHFTSVIEIDLSSIEPCLSGPSEPHQRVLLKDVSKSFATSLTSSDPSTGFKVKPENVSAKSPVTLDQETLELAHGAIAIAAITSCTNTSNPYVMAAAGLVAKKAVAKGLKVSQAVKTSLAPGSTVVADYLQKANLLEALEQLGFHIVGYGCTTCIGNSGPLDPRMEAAIAAKNLVASAVLSGNRNFSGRIHPAVKANYLASPPLVVAYAILGSTAKDINSEPLGTGTDGKPVYLKDVWPTENEVVAVVKAITPEMFISRQDDLWSGSEKWRAIPSAESMLFPWDEKSTYVRKPPFLDQVTDISSSYQGIRNARILGLFGDGISTDHISPAGAMENDSPAAKYLLAHGVQELDFNTYGARRGNHEVMVRGTFANKRLKNKLVPDTEGNWTICHLSGEKLSFFDASQKYIEARVPLVLIAGKNYGQGSSRDWAAKGPRLQGVKAAIAESFERIHRSNLVGMGILPLVFQKGESAASLGISGKESIEIEGVAELKPRQLITVKVTFEDGKEKSFQAICRLDSAPEVNCFLAGGLLPQTVGRMMKGS